MTLPHGTYSENFPVYGNLRYSFGGPNVVCKAGGEFYLMTHFVYQGKIYNVAKTFTKFE